MYALTKTKIVNYESTDRQEQTIYGIRNGDNQTDLLVWAIGFVSECTNVYVPGDCGWVRLSVDESGRVIADRMSDYDTLCIMGEVVARAGSVLENLDDGSVK
jgi:hypothetical protein